ncbi:helix-turn-helix transcriptional regulator [Patulibacter minatonensis]|uniref:helix-turn-helix transcriptional regulator n=1 Tax=Patulibacter minatonensis TaxID=298163 RepID=UPI0004BCADC0|nr:LuxR C-terminal-related transcriptional regulator [Patulibacter minatonensis]
MLTRPQVRGRSDVSADPIRDPVLRGAVVDVVGRVDRALETPSTDRGAADALVDAEVARAELAVRVVRLAERLRRPPGDGRWTATRDQLVDLLLDVRVVAERVEVEATDRRAGILGRLAVAVTAVRRVGTLDELLDVAPSAVVGLGFRRAVLSAARNGVFVTEHCLDLDHPDREDAIVRAGSEPPVLLDRGLRETDLVRSRQPIVVADAQGDPRGHPGLARATGWTSYVAAPVTLRDRVVGFVHADRGVAPVGPREADLLGVLADAAGATFERLAAEHRSREARDQVRRAVRSIEAAFDPGAVRAPRAQGQPRPEVEGLLTAREAEVLRLMATGATNAAIAATLVIAEGTAKTHVKNILRKLEVGNRAEAVSRFLGGVDDGDDVG